MTATSNEPTWQEHLAWCKKRALWYVRIGDMEQAVASMGSDIAKYRGENAPKRDLVATLVLSAAMGPQDAGTIRRWIEGWN